MTNNQKVTICFVASPLQLICINEFIKKNKCENYELFFLYSNQNQLAMKQMYKTFEKFDYKDFINFRMPKSKVLRLFFEIFFILKLKTRYSKKKISFVIIDFRNIFMQSLRRFFRNSNFTLIDDGFYSYVAYENYISKNLYLPISRYSNLIGMLKKWLYFGKSFNYLKVTPFEIFTIYADEIKNKNTKFNDLNELRNLRRNDTFNISEELVYFIGTGMPERNAITIDQELSLIKKIRDYWEKKGKKFYYVGKRASSRKKLNYFNKNNIQTLQYDLPLELVLIEMDKIPKHICHLGSTLSKSLSLIFDYKINFYFIDIIEYFSKNHFGVHVGMDEVDLAARNYAKISKRNNLILSYDDYM